MEGKLSAEELNNLNQRDKEQGTEIVTSVDEHKDGIGIEGNWGDVVSGTCSSTAPPVTIICCPVIVVGIMMLTVRMVVVGVVTSVVVMVVK